MEIGHVALICHEANRMMQVINGDEVATSWDALSEEQRERITNGVAFRLRNPACTPAIMHQNWIQDMRADGYVLGERIDHKEKIHPNMVPFEDLSLEQKAKDMLFSGIVDSLRECVT